MPRAHPDPELAFVLACIRMDGRATEARAVAAAAVRDWDEVTRIALAHDVSWWVARALPVSGVPETVRHLLAGVVRAQAGRALAGTRELLAIVDALERAGVGALAYKGPALGVDIHGDVATRHFTDLDLLVAERELPAARAALATLGYEPPAGYTAREARFYGAWEGVAQLQAAHADWPVELHWCCQARRYGAPQDPAPLVAAGRVITVGGARVMVPGVEAQAALLALHGVKHGWGSLLWVADLAHAVQRDGFDWDRLQAIVASWRQQRALHDAVLVAHELLAVHVPARLLERARGDARAVRLAHAAVDDMLGRADAEDVGRESTARYDLQWVGGAWARARYLALAAALPTPREREAVRLPDALLPLAYPLRAARVLGHALGWRG